MACVLARMEDLGLIRRNRLQEDQRRVMVRLAAKGDKLITEIAPLIDARYHEMEAAFGKNVFDDLFKVLENFIEADERFLATAKQPPMPDGDMALAPPKGRKR
jgi:DNA-binding MarR family transcriptional regulator